MKFLAAALGLLLAFPLAKQDEKVELKWKYRKGQEMRYRSLQTTTMEFGGATIKQEMGHTMAMSVTDLDEKGVATVTCKYDAVSIKAAFPAELDYDSDKDKEPPDEPTARMFSKMVGQSFTMKMTSSGRVVDVKGFDKIFEAMAKAAGDDQADVARTMLKQMFSDDSYKSMMQQMTPQLPEEKVGKGDTWANEFTVRMPIIGAMKFGIKSKLNDLKDQNALIDQDIKIELKPGDDKDNPPIPVEIKDAKGKASSVFSIERGLFLSQKATLEMTISASGQELPIKTETEFKLVEKKKNY